MTKSKLLMEESGVMDKNHWPAASNCQILQHNVVSSSHCQVFESN
jgi:hypothetical protein